MNKQKPKILIVDDEVLNIEIMTDVLQKNGIDTISAMNSDDAIKLLKDEKPDIAILDMNIPGISGNKIIENNPDLIDKYKVIIISGFISSEDEKKLREQGFQHYFHKPVNFDELILRIKKIIATKENS